MKTHLIYPLLIFIFIAVFFTCGTEPENRSLHGFVYDSATSEPVPGVVVTAGGLTDTTSFEGYYDLGGLPSGQYSLSTNRVCYENHMQTIDVDDGINEISINLELEELPVSRIYDVEWIESLTLNEFRNKPEEYIDWPEVIELDNDSLKFTGRVKLGKNGWLPIEPVWKHDKYYVPRVSYLIPIPGPSPDIANVTNLYTYLIFALVENRVTDEQITGWTGMVKGWWDYSVPFYAVFRQ